MKKIRFTFCRADCIKYLSNIEIEKMFVKAFNFLKDKMKVAYSNESNSTPKLDFALDLPIGMESIGEVAEVEMEEDIKIPFFIKALNEVLPQGVAVLSAEYVDTEDNENLYLHVCSAIYEIWFIYGQKDFDDKNKRQIEDIKKWYIDRMREYLSQNKIYIVRKKDDKVERMNVKQEISGFSFRLDNTLIVTMDAGQKSNLTPEDIMKGYDEYSGQHIDYSVRRRKIYIR